MHTHTFISFIYSYLGNLESLSYPNQSPVAMLRPWNIKYTTAKGVHKSTQYLCNHVYSIKA